MDQLKKALAWLKKNHFWVLTGLIVVIGLGCWYSSTGVLAKQFKENQVKIQGAFSTAGGISSKPFHPNDEINKQQTAEIQKRFDQVIATWDELYKRQRAEMLNWPAELGTEFATAVAPLKFGDNIPRDLLEVYRLYAETFFPQLPKIVGAPIRETSGGRGPAGGGREPAGGREPPGGGRPGAGTQVMEEPDEEFICDWLDQQSVRDQLQQFTQTPSALRVWVTQENLWAYQTLLNVVAATNKNWNADRQSNAVVSQITSLEVGQPAAAASRTPERIKLADGVAAPLVVAAVGEGGRGESGGRGEGGGRDGQAETADGEAARLLSGRYVDADGKPIAYAGDIKTLGQEYKRLPVRLVIKMDLKGLSFLITQCANQPLQVEVQEVRINPNERAGSGSRDAPVGLRMNSPGGVEQFLTNEDIATVVVQGVIYIYNEPDRSIMPATDAPVATN